MRTRQSSRLIFDDSSVFQQYVIGQMSELKKHNSIIFLTTLSVYLGLVLVGGASSPILAQAALTRNFDIQEEIEYKDDLDKKPDEKSDESFEGKRSLRLYADVLSQLIEKASLPDYEASIVVNCELCRQKFNSEFSLKENLPVVSKLNVKPKTPDLDSIGLISQINAELHSLHLEPKDYSEKLVLDNTSVITENNRIFVITHLPRASIDSLFAEKDAS